MLPDHQIGDGGFMVGAVRSVLRTRRANLAIVVDDDVVIFGVPGDGRIQ